MSDCIHLIGLLVELPLEPLMRGGVAEESIVKLWYEYG
jgi:hypothetical protein